MTTITIEVPDEVAESLNRAGLDLAEILASATRPPESASKAELWATLRKLTSRMRPQEVMALRPSEELNSRIDELTRKETAGLITAAEEEELRLFDIVEHQVRMAKLAAKAKIEAA